MNTVQRLIRRAYLRHWPLDRIMALLRFAIVGLTSSAVYATTTVLGTSIGGWEPNVSSAIAYVLAMAVNFPLHRHFTFGSSGSVRQELPKYLGLHLFYLLISTGLVHLTAAVMEWPVTLSVLIVIVVIPVIQFLALEAWVFSTGRQK